MLTSLFGQAIFGWLLADFLSGLFHWWEDRVGDTTMPVLGKHVVVPNRRHHTDQLAFLQSTIIHRNLVVWSLSFIIACLWLTFFGPSVVLLFAILGGLLVNEIHGWAHRPAKAPKVVRVLQDMGLFQSPKHHSDHHRRNTDTHYCILTNVLNPILDHFHVWERLEIGLERIGLTPNRGSK